MKISFDFDGTLARRKVRAIAWLFLKGGHDVFILSSRSAEDRNVVKVYEAAEFLDLPHDKIIFTDGEPKYRFLESFDMHFDNNASEVEMISKHLPSVACFLVNNYKTIV